MTEQMKGHQLLRTVGITAIVAAYLARLVVVGNGSIEVIGYQLSPIGLVAIAVAILAAPELIEHIPFGPSKK